MRSSLTADRLEPAAGLSTSLYRAVWRWHFYAGLLCLPFLVVLAVTGGLYLFKDEIDGIVYRSLLTVPAQATASLPASELVDLAMKAVPGTPSNFAPPGSPTASAAVTVKDAAGDKTSVYLDPHDGRVLGTVAEHWKLDWILKKIHSLEILGWAPNRVMEIVGGWTLLLVASGLYLWWPRGRNDGVWSVRVKPGRRIMWRDIHAVAGAYGGLFIFFLAFTGLPWSGYWGSKFNTLATEAGMGYPPELWDDVPKSDEHAGHAMAKVNWTLENTPMPESTPAGTAPLGLDKAVAAFAALGFGSGYTVDLPTDATGVYTASWWPDDVRDERVTHLDQYSGKVLFDARFADFGGVAQATEWGISIHQGQQFGLLNQLVMLAACISIVVMAVAAGVMWWKRRPAGRLGVPPPPANKRAMLGVTVIALVVGTLYPLVGLSILVMLAIDFLLPRRWKERFA